VSASAPLVGAKRTSISVVSAFRRTSSAQQGLSPAGGTLADFKTQPISGIGPKPRTLPILPLSDCRNAYFFQALAERSPVVQHVSEASCGETPPPASPAAASGAPHILPANNRPAPPISAVTPMSDMSPNHKAHRL